jgi:hypothetical protein
MSSGRDDWSRVFDYTEAMTFTMRLDKIQVSSSNPRTAYLTFEAPPEQPCWAEPIDVYMPVEAAQAYRLGRNYTFTVTEDTTRTT